MIIIIYLLTIYKAAIIQCIDIVHLQCHFGEPLFFFFCLYFIYIYIYILLYWHNKFHNYWDVKRKCAYNVFALYIYSAILLSHFVFFFFFKSSICTFFFLYIYTVILTQQISQYFHNYWQCFGNVHLMSSYSA